MKLQKTGLNGNKLKWLLLGILSGMNAGAAPLNLPDVPLFVSNVKEPPLILLTMGRDHKLYYEAYNDASDLNDDGNLDIRYDPSIDYYGYFDSSKCYTYSSTDTRFEPTVFTSDKTCSGAFEWSGDFLNYLTTSRMDALRGVLYGGYRSTDTASLTVLERSYIPQDAHSWGKEYTSIAVDGFDIRDYTPLDLPATDKRHLFANTTLGSSSTVGAPLLRVLNDSPYRVWEWLSIERPVAGSKCVNQSTNCVTAAPTPSYVIVPASATEGLSDITRQVYKNTGCGSGCDQTPDNYSEMDAFQTVAVGNGVFGSDTPTNIDNANSDDDFTSPPLTNDYFTLITGTLNITLGGSYYFGVDGDDGVEFSIDTTGDGFTSTDVIATFYGSHGFSSSPSTHSGLVILPPGSYDFRYRHAEDGVDAGFKLFWAPPTGGVASTMTDFTVRVKVCVSGLLESNCKQYPDGNYKPTGILHQYGENDSMKFGLLTGSYKKNLSGGILRKKMGSFTDEVNINTDGTLTSTVGIIKTINNLRVIGFSGGGTYTHDSNCGFVFNQPRVEGDCRLWGNPIAEMMYEGTRYFAGKAAPTSDFTFTTTGTDDATLGLPFPAWDNPYDPTTGANECALPMQLVISDINPSYDTDKLPGVNSNFGSFTGDVTGLDVEDIADSVITPNEPEIPGNHFIGQVGATYNGAPTPKTVTTVGAIRGLAPEEPTKQGGYYSSSVSYFGKNEDINPVTGSQHITTLAVAVASPLPKFEIPVAGKIVTLVPFAKSVGGGSWGIDKNEGAFQPTNAIVDFYVEEIANTNAMNADPGTNNGLPYYKFRINFEDAEAGADHDMDAIVEYTFFVDDNGTASDNTDDTVSVELNSLYAAGSVIQHLGYVISGTTTDGIYLELRDTDTASGSDVDYFLDTPNTASTALPLTSNRSFTPGSTTAATLMKDPLWYAAKWGGFQDSNDNDLPDQQSEWDEDSDGIPDTYFLVTNAGKLKEQLDATFQKITELVGASASSVAINSTVLRTNARLYQAKFNTADWSGELSAFTLNSDATINSEVWRATEHIPDAASRKIFTSVDKSGTLTPILFNDSDADLVAAIGSTDLVNYLRGDAANELANGGLFRDRSVRLADIINASPVSVGADNFFYNVLSTANGGAAYNSYLAQKVNNYKDTDDKTFSIVFAGSNDGMIHAFQDTWDTDPSNAGKEIFAYVPSVLHGGLSELASTGYDHRYYVDASPFVSDVFFDFDSDGVPEATDWRTMLVGALGGGGRSVYAIDVTDVHTLVTSDVDTFDISDVMWEYNVTDPTSVSSPDHSEEMGYIMSQPQLVLLNNDKFAVIFGNGYNSYSHRAQLFILDAETGAEIKVIDTEVGSSGTPNGLAMPFLLDENGDRKVDTVYAGDLLGNMWKFDLKGGSVSSWGVAYKTGSTPKPLITIADGLGAAQAITTRPVVVKHPTSGFVVLFGTGKYLETGDNILPLSPQEQSFYGVRDSGAKITTGRSELLEQTILAEIDIYDDHDTPATGDDTFLNTTRVVTETQVDYTVDKGWFIDLVSPNPADPPVPPSFAKGEMVISNPLTRFERVIFTTFIPPEDPCTDAGGTAVLMEVDAVNGARLENSVFDLNNDSVIDAEDFVDLEGIAVPGSGIFIPATLASPAVISAEDASKEFKLTSGISGTITTTQEATGGITVGRQSWRQIR
jgi:type IV pilus assembly protein PilY1